MWSAGTIHIVKTTGELANLLRQRGRKMTPQRQLLCTLLEHDSTHPTADALFAAARVSMPTISLRTVYSVLNDLVELGQVRTLDLGTGATRFDPNVESRHYHLVCIACGAVRDLNAGSSDFALPPGHPSGFEVYATEVVHRGRCSECAARATSQADAAGHEPLSRQATHEQEVPDV